MRSAAAMTSRERWLAALSLEPVDRLPFWPKLDGAYPRARTGRFAGADLNALHDFIGSDPHVWISGGAREVRRRSSIERVDSPGGCTVTYRTPSGEMRAQHHFDEPSQSWHPVEFPVKTVDDIRRMIDAHEDAVVEADEGGLAKAREQQDAAGSDALTAVSLGTSPLMEWVESLAGVENAHYFLADYPGEVEALFDAMMRPLLRRTEILADRSPANILYLIENTSTTLISPEQFRRYAVPQIRAVGETVAAADATLVLHMCGKLKALLADIATLPAAGVEAFTAPPLGDTTLADGRAACPDACFVGGTHAMLWTRPAREIIAHVERSLDALPHHRGIVVTSAGVMPPMCEPETIKAVCEWVKQYPAKM